MFCYLVKKISIAKGDNFTFFCFQYLYFVVDMEEKKLQHLFVDKIFTRRIDFSHKFSFKVANIINQYDRIDRFLSLSSPCGNISHLAQMYLVSEI